MADTVPADGPRRTGAHYPEHPVEHCSGIGWRSAAPLLARLQLRKQVFDDCPLLLGEFLGSTWATMISSTVILPCVCAGHAARSVEPMSACLSTATSSRPNVRCAAGEAWVIEIGVDLTIGIEIYMAFLPCAPLVVTRIQIQSATLINGLGGRDDSVQTH